jgi:hypothetical protein
MGIIELMQRALDKTNDPDAIFALDRGITEVERLRNVVALLIEYEEHDENILKGAVMWEALIEAAHRALMEKP